MKKILALFALMVVHWSAPPTVDAQQRGDGQRGYQSQPTQRAHPARSPTQRRQPIRGRSTVRPASHTESIVEGEVIYEGDYVPGDIPGFAGDMHGGASCDGCGGGGCGSCQVSGTYCNSCNVPRRFCICFPAHGWVQAEYLHWYQDGMRVPTLATTSPGGTPRAQAGVQGEGNPTSVLIGNNELLDDDRSGFRIRFGWWLASFPGWGVEGEYAGLSDEAYSQFLVSGGSPTIARPFFNILTGAEDSSLVAFTNPNGQTLISGNLAFNAFTQFDGAAARLRRQGGASEDCGFSWLCNQTVPTSSRLDATVGYRFWQLNEGLAMRESSTADDGEFLIHDSFDTRNQFNGAEVGFVWQARRGWWSLDSLLRLGIGNMHQTVTVAGSSRITENGSTDIFDTGFLAQRTNIGTHDRDQFVMVPEIGVTLGYQWTKRLRLTAGYSAVYLGNVVRPGDQIDTDLNPNLLAPEVTPFTGALRPQFDFVQTDYLVQGLSFGGEFRW